MYGKSPKTFIMDENDSKFVKFEQIKKILRSPKMSTAGNRIIYEFDRKIEELYEMQEDTLVPTLYDNKPYFYQVIHLKINKYS